MATKSRARAADKPQAKASPALEQYNAKRDFLKTAEPAGKAATRRRKAAALGFVIQKHWASRLHYDFRLELDGVLMSWAVPKGPSFDPADKQTAIHVEDHPVSYGPFEGTIPKKQYGAGTVIVWENGTWEPVGDPREGMTKGKLLFKLHGQKLAGLWELVRISKPGEKDDRWILFKKKGDAWARPRADYDVITALPDSVTQKPLGLVEDRERRVAADPVRSSAADVGIEPDLSEAVRAKLPAAFKPQLATLAAAPPAGGDWILETKFDGYRILARIDKGTVKLFTRNGHDWTHKMEALAADIAELGIESGWIDGEIVVMNAQGVPDFNALQNAMGTTKGAQVDYFAFDIPYFGGLDLRRVPTRSRRAVLRKIFDQGTPPASVRFSDDFDAPPGQMVAAACQMGLEGIMLKRADSPYVSDRTDTWLKLKCGQRQEFVVVGFTDRTNAPSEVGSLLLGYHQDGKLRYAGSVGTGWSSADGRQLHELMLKHETDAASVDVNDVKPGRWSKRKAGSERWVKPVLVAEVAFSEWTPDGHVRHPSFKGMRSDKPSKAITREKATLAPGGAQVTAKPSASVKVSNPGRVIDPTMGHTKLELVRFYESIAEWMLPHLKDRPVSLVRAPTGITGQLFFQKHPETRMSGLTSLDPKLWPGHDALLAIDHADALLAAAQMNVIEFHTWNSTIEKIEQPDRIVFDLDPGEGVTWPMIQEAAQLMRAMLQALSLESWIKTSGGKGLHVVVPITPKLGYEVVKAFSQAVVRHMSKTIPDRFVAKSGGTNRVGKIFIDYLRNGHGQTTAAAFSARSRPGLGVSITIDWDELPDIRGGAHWTIATAREYLSFRKTDPWVGYWKCRQTLIQPFKRLGFEPAKGGK
ncbi:MAG: DNA ligase D [Polaromonas sp.]|nr:DNA ligase D [Polaromonas sp.]